VVAEVEMPKKWYVYFLCDPDTGVPFYVGKGKGDRINGHERYIDSPGVPNDAKKAVIRRIQARGKQVLKKRVAEFTDESEAYRYERELIKLHKSTLTNIRGGLSTLNRKQKQKQKQVKDYSYLESQILTIEEVAKVLNEQVSSVKALAKRRVIVGFRTSGNKGLLRFRRQAIEEYIEEQEEKGQQGE
jgi:excisionase family DNA binding protein